MTGKPTRNWIALGCLLVAALFLMVGCREEAPPPPRPTATPTATTEPTAGPTATATSPATSTPRPTSTPTPTPRPPTMQDLAAQYPELAAVLNNPEVAPAYKELLIAYQRGGQQGAINRARQLGILSADGNVRAVLVTDTEDTGATVSRLQGMGVTVTNVSGNRIEIAVPPALVLANADQPHNIMNQLAYLDHVVGVQPPW